MRQGGVKQILHVAVLRCCFWIVLGGVLLPGWGRANVLEEFGSLEREAIELALQKKQLVVDANAQGKKIDQIHVVNFPVFLQDDWSWIRWLNVLHWTTREYVIADQVILEHEEVYTQERADEAQRKLRNPLFSTLAAIVPVKSKKAGYVDILVVTRDVWSIRLNSNYEIQRNRLTYLFLSFSENNVLGRRKKVALTFSMDLGAYYIGPAYIDPNVLGERVTLSASGGAIFERGTNKVEGSQSSITFGSPLWSLNDRWSWSWTMAHRMAPVRFFVNNRLATYDAPETLEDDQIPWVYNRAWFQNNIQTTYSRGKAVKSNISVGYQFRTDHSRSPAGPAFTEQTRASFERDVLPRSERTSGVRISHALFRAKYRKLKNLNLFDLTEDLRIGGRLDSSVLVSPKVFGSDDNYMTASTSASWRQILGRDGVFFASLGGGLRWDKDGVVDRSASTTVFVASPMLNGWIRLVAGASLSGLFRNQNNSFYGIGGDNGLRGFEIGEFLGQRRFIANFEGRTNSTKMWFMRVGGLAFVDLGHAADRFEDLRPKSDIGVGLRVVIPQLGAVMQRFDIAFPMQGHRKWQPRITAGVGQVF